MTDGIRDGIMTTVDGALGRDGVRTGSCIYTNWGDSLIGWTNKVRSDGQARVLVRVRDTVSDCC